MPDLRPLLRLVLPRPAAFAALGALAATLAPAVAHAAQELVLDTGEYAHVADNTTRNAAVGKANAGLKGSHAFFRTTAFSKTSWIAPVDYRNGEMHVVIDVLEKPSAQVVRLSVCMDDGGVSCVSQAEFTKTGRYTFGRKTGSSYSVNPNYGRGFGIAAVILRDGGAAEGKKLDLGQGFMGEPDYSRYFPLKMRVRAWLVSPGATFAPPNDAADGGAPDAGGSGAGVDAGASGAGGGGETGTPGGTSSGSTGAGTSSGAAGGGSSGSGAGPDDGDGDGDRASSGRPSFGDEAADGCTTTGAKGSSLAASLALAGLGLVALRRRRR